MSIPKYAFLCGLGSVKYCRFDVLVNHIIENDLFNVCPREWQAR